MTFQEYKDSIVKEFEDPQILHANNDHNEKNCGGTGDREAPKGISWIDYWRAMTNNTANTMYCSSCGKEIFVGDPTEEQKKKFSVGNDTIEKHRAHGGHIWVESSSDKSYPGGRYITPLCPNCNGQHDKDIPIKKGSVFCKEVGASKQK